MHNLTELSDYEFLWSRLRISVSILRDRWDLLCIIFLWESCSLSVTAGIH